MLFPWDSRRLIALAIVAFTAFASFGFGYLADHELNRTPIVIERCSSP